MTLVVLAEVSDDAAALGETLAALMPEHPGPHHRGAAAGRGEPALGARVYSQCWMPFGQRRQICCEQIEITASDAALADLPPVVLPLAVPDLPVILWCRSARLVDRPEFGDLAGMARKVVVDSAQLGEPHDRDRSRRASRAPRASWWRPGLDAPHPLARNAGARLRESRIPRAAAERVCSRESPTDPERETSALYLRAWLQRALESCRRASCDRDRRPAILLRSSCRAKDCTWNKPPSTVRSWSPSTDCRTAPTCRSPPIT